MTDAPASPPPASSGPAPGAAADTTAGTRPGPRQPTEAPNLLDQGPQPATDGGEQSDRLTPDEERQLGELQAKAARAAAGGRVIEVRVDEPHSEMHYGGIRVTTDWTQVPEHMIGLLETAAADAGVTLTQKES